MIRFKVIRAAEDSARFIAWAKREASRLIGAGSRTFIKTWKVEDVTIHARAAELLGDIIVKLSIERDEIPLPPIINQLARAYDWRRPINFTLQTVAPVAGFAWYDKVTAVVLPALAPAVTFGVGVVDIPAGQLVNAGAAPPTGLLRPATLVETFRRHVVAGHEAAIRHWFGLLRSYMTIQYQLTQFGTVDNEMMVSRPDGAGNFYLLWGRWDRAIGDGGFPIPNDPLHPIEEQFTGLIISSVSLSAQAAQATDKIVDFDRPVTSPGYVAPRRYGAGYNVYRRLQQGVWPNSAVDFTVPFRSRYRPDFAGGGLAATGSPYAIAYFDRQGVSTGYRAERWTYTFERHKLASSGSIVVESIPSPALATPTSSWHNGTTLLTVSVSCSEFTTDVVFFDGEDFIKVGQHHQTATEQSRVDGVDISDVEGIASVTGSFESASVAFHGSTAPRTLWLDYFLPEFGIAYISNPAAGTDHLVGEAEFTSGAFNDSRARSVIALTTSFENFPRLQRWGGGPAWGDYQYIFAVTPGADQNGRWNESGFTCAGFAALPSGGIVQTMTLYRPPRGVFWFRRDGTTGIFLYRLIVDITVDARKYRNVYLGVNGFIKSQPGWEDPLAILARIMLSIAVDVNNFGTPAMIPWIEDEHTGDMVIVDG